MPISIKNEETEDIARKLAALTGETLTMAIRTALAERYDRVRQGRRRGYRLADELNAIGIRCANRPVISSLSDEAILGYDEHGVPVK